MRYEEVRRKLDALGCQELPRRGGKDLKIGTVRAIVRQLQLDRGEFRRS